MNMWIYILVLQWLFCGSLHFSSKCNYYLGFGITNTDFGSKLSYRKSSELQNRALHTILYIWFFLRGIIQARFCMFCAQCDALCGFNRTKCFSVAVSFVHLCLCYLHFGNFTNIWISNWYTWWERSYAMLSIWTDQGWYLIWRGSWKVISIWITPTACFNQFVFSGWFNIPSRNDTKASFVTTALQQPLYFLLL